MTQTVNIRCVVIDDEEAAIEVLKYFILQIPGLIFCGGFTSPIEALEMIRKQKPDVVFTDIHMPQISGIDLINNLTHPCKIILTTAYSEYALQGYDLNICDYLLKPISFNRFLQTVEKIKYSFFDKGKAASITDDFILVKGESKGKLFKIDLNDIDYIQGMKNYAAINCGNKKIISLLNLKDLEDQLPFQKFIRIHKSFIVSIAKIMTIEGNKILIKNGSPIDILIGENYKAAFLERMKNNLI